MYAINLCVRKNLQRAEIHILSCLTISIKRRKQIQTSMEMAAKLKKHSCQKRDNVEIDTRKEVDGDERGDEVARKSSKPCLRDGACTWNQLYL